MGREHDPRQLADHWKLAVTCLLLNERSMMFSYLHSRKFRLSAILALGAASGAMVSAAAGQPTSPAKLPPLVGRWQQVTTCQQFVQSLRQVGLEKLAPAMISGK